MNKQEIINNAPEEATHVTCGMYYWKWNSQSGWRIWCDVLVMWTTRPSPTSSVQSIADIKRIVELENIALELVSIVESHHDSAYCDEFNYDELQAVKEALKEPKP